MTAPDRSRPRAPRIREAAKKVVRLTYRNGLWLVPSRKEIPELLNRRGLVGSGVEVGVATGVYSSYLLANWKGERLISVDPWRKADDPEGWDGAPQELREERYREAVGALAPFGSRSEIWRMTSAEAAAQTPGRSLDFVYIDAWHAYESVRQDIQAWEEKVRPGGLLCGHDFLDGVFSGYPYGVRTAVTEFCAERGLRYSLTRRNEPRSWMIEIP